MNLCNKNSAASRLHCELALFMYHFRNISLNATAAPRVSLLISRGRMVQMIGNNPDYRHGCYSVPFLPTLSNAAPWEWINSVNTQSELFIISIHDLGGQHNKHPIVIFFHPFPNSLKHSIFFLNKEENRESGLLFFFFFFPKSGLKFLRLEIP